MKITTIIENTLAESHENLDVESGLSLLIEKEGKKVLFDTGLSPKMISNAQKLGIKLEEVDVCIISHGHYDHTGGLKEFLKLNSKAKVYIKNEAQGEFFFKLGPIKKPIGVPPEIFTKYADRLVLLAEDAEPLPGVHIITQIERNRPLWKSNKKLFKNTNDHLVHDDFKHELIVVLEENGGIMGLTGCSHSGIRNMIDTISSRFPATPIKTVIGGFHLMGIPLLKNSMAGSVEEVEDIARDLLKYVIPKIYTCHCTGKKAYGIMHQVMGDKLGYLATGDIIEL